eukprot:CAMPEP_0117563302 /NCGR_PEP_ID=MMETSP0784-20121206/55425_1 /TAXON_ID=39447 /ORGANISM="" /LENGTH=46 /DNA_ID= /DNA_START= /DNA_END= /DNA_ORIENTATION=
MATQRLGASSGSRGRLGGHSTISEGSTSFPSDTSSDPVIMQLSVPS